MHEYFAQVGINSVISRRPEDEKGRGWKTNLNKCFSWNRGEKKKDTEEEARKEERASDTYSIFLFVLTAFEISGLQKIESPMSQSPSR